MCRGFQENERDRLLKIKAFYLSLSLSKTPNHLPDSLTLHYLPRINGSPLEINGSVIRPDAPVFVSLHRVVSDEGKGKRSAIYGSRDRVRVCDGMRYEVYFREEKAVKGNFRKDEGGEWKMECRCGLEGEGEVEVKHVEVCVAAEGEGEVMKEKVEMVVKRRKKGMCFVGLEEIPEQQSEGEEVEGYCCCCCDCTGGEGAEDEGDVEVEGVRWAVDVGIWVICLGVGYLVSKASSKSLRRRRLM